ncbi:MAG TPA: MoaD/ThiS family protein [Gemmatimonadaceae bacterium]|nr:MoaD/ThiS family protein [Gemmatimonadaceae bacterium]
MTVTVRFFASYAESLGRDALEMTLAEGSTVGDVLGSVRGLPGADRLPPAPLVAVNYSYAQATMRLSEGDEVAIIPPVAGG